MDDTASTPNLFPDEPAMSDDYTLILRRRIAQGVASARQGRLVDGPSVFARIEAEMQQAERRR